jgi:NitT/TauT family transport system substrate-binding protein
MNSKYNDNLPANRAIGMLGRRGFLKTAAAVVAATGPGLSLLIPRDGQAATAKVVVQYDWLMGNGQVGDIVAVKKGFFEEQGLELAYSPGGPNAQTVPPVVSGQAALGQFSGVSQLLLARASGVPVKVIATGYQKGPFTFFSLPKAAIRTPQDFIGKRVGIQPTAHWVIDAILAKHKIDPSKVKVQNIGFDMTPLVSGEVDTVTGFITNTKAMSVIGPDRIDLGMVDAGLPDFANAYFATDEAIEKHSDLLARFIKAVAKGWGWTHEHPTEAVELMVKAWPELDLQIEKDTIKTVLALSFTPDTAKNGWGTFDQAKIAEEISIFDSIGLFKGTTLKVEDVQTSKILELTVADRPKVA